MIRPSLYVCLLALFVATVACGESSAAITDGLVDVGGHRLYIECTGEGSPTVVMDAGLTLGGDDWSPVQPQIAEFTRVCNYDRAGVGRSEAGPTPRTSQTIVEELDSLLSNANIDGPFILVGHSFGAINMSLFADRLPDRVAGLVLVDGMHPESISGMRRIMGPAIWDSIETQTLENDEGVDLLRSSSQLSPAGSLGDTPLVVLAAGRRLAPPFSTRMRIAAELENLWQELQRDMAGWSSQGELVIAAKSGHCIHCQEPEVVVNAVRQVVEAARD